MRNPLATALWSAELLVRLAPEERSGPRGEKLSGMALRALQRLRILMEDHFLAERLAISGIPLQQDVVGLQEALEAVVKKSSGVHVEHAIDDRSRVLGDRAMIERVLDALLACASRGKVPVRIEAERGAGAVTLRFTGAPPPDGALDLPSKSSPSDTTGRVLSAYMAFRIAEALGGRLELEGGAYVLTLPLETRPVEGRPR